MCNFGPLAVGKLEQQEWVITITIRANSQLLVIASRIRVWMPYAIIKCQTQVL